MMNTFFYKKHDGLFILIILILIVLSLLFVGVFTERTVFETTKKRMENALSFQSATLKATMDKYAVLVALISRRSDITYALLTDDPLSAMPEVDQLTNFLAGISGASDVWIVNQNGDVLAGTNSDIAPKMIASEAYFQAAMEGRLGRASSILSNGQRIYLLASPVINNNKILGVIVVRLDLEYLEQVWVLLQDPMLVTNDEGRVLLSSVKAWRYKSFLKNTSSADVEFSEKDLSEKNYLVEKITNDAQGRFILNKELVEEKGREYFHVSLYDGVLGWRVHALSDYQYIREQRNTAVLIALLIISLLLMAYVLYASRKQRLLKEQRSQEAFSKRLERQVLDRTHALTIANNQLAVEIDERRLAEKQLRSAQEELIQAAKLAGIGQMSTALAHEYNQPLAAIRSYTENAELFLKNENIGATKDNLGRIKMLVDKMAALTQTLRNFAHKSENRLDIISVDKVMDELLILLSPQAKKQKVNLRFIGTEEPVFILGEQGHLSQVITNLVTNAMDAVMDQDLRQVDIVWSKLASSVCISVKDSGPGISEEVQKNMFNAFYTTKNKGNGLGLGLFIVMNCVNYLKGYLELKTEGDYGAVFEIHFPLPE